MDEDYFGFDESIPSSEEQGKGKGFLEEHFFKILIGGCLGGILVLVVVISIIISVSKKVSKKTRAGRVDSEEPTEPPVTSRAKNLSSREQKVLSLFMKSSK